MGVRVNLGPGRVGCALALACASAWADPPALVGSLCTACHGEAGNSLVPTFPRLAAQNSEYLAKQLGDFLAGKRKSDVMAPIVAQIKASDVPELAAYYAGQKPAAGSPQDDKQAAAGRQLFDDGNTATGVPACVGCHQPGGAGNERYPRLAGQHAAYTLAQMQAFKTGSRTNDKARVMRSVAERLSDDEMAAVAAYLAGL